MEWIEGRPPLNREGRYDCRCRVGIDDYGDQFVINVVIDSLPGEREHFAVEYEDGTFVPVSPGWNDIEQYRQIPQ